ncbi:MAG: phosphodiester glycosidase family protein [Bacteroidota bacterium]
MIQRKKYTIKYFLHYALLLIFLLSFLPVDSYIFCKTTKSKQTKSTKTKVANTTKYKNSKSTKSKKKRRRRVRYYAPAKINTSVSAIMQDTTLEAGVYYRVIHFGKPKKHITVHVIEADLLNTEIKLGVLKAKNLADELEKLQDMIRRSDTTTDYNVLGAVNGNFWRAYHNTPIGPTVINGEVVEMRTHKRWSAAFFDEDSRMYIDNFFMDGSVELNRKLFSLDNINRRTDTSGIIMYNHFSGDTIPFISKQNLDWELNQAIKEITESEQDSILNDSTEVEFDTLKLRQEIFLSRRSEMSEYKLYKAQLVYLDTPTVNKEIRCRVIGIDTGAVEIPDKGCLISFGSDFPQKSLPKKDDILKFRFSTNVYESNEFYNSVSGTPRLVRHGLAKHEAYEEGSKGRRFINQQLPRTAIGTDKYNRKLFLVAVESNCPNDGKYGATLAQLSTIMKQLGCYEAMNLDGGGSTLMAVGCKNVLYKSRPEASRRLSVGVAIMQKKNINTILQKRLKGEH